MASGVGAVHRTHTPAAGAGSVRLHDRARAGCLPRRGSHAALQPDARVAGATGHVRFRSGGRHGRGGALEGAAADAAVRRGWLDGGAAHRFAALGNRGGAGGVIAGNRVRARPAEHPELRFHGGVSRHLRTRAPAMAAAGAVAGLGQLPRRIFPGMDHRGRLHSPSVAAPDGRAALAGGEPGHHRGFWREPERLRRNRGCLAVPAEPVASVADRMVAGEFMGIAVCVRPAAVCGGADHDLVVAAGAAGRLAAGRGVGGSGVDGFPQ